ncbi:hypothetical protein EYE40_07145 [Glaciihabitans arcticus]|uniref:Uncharacterized protein n=1 Tax=Glaciihabitans arcticus TaxID=2668039 RepID=A0A4Q9GQN9_9MICO|nr:hypothetical protein [Glaciihabitans arcticus]TBN57192.1 hypothetical protein EYE40_07145 [Glaciihabitans arcticus]
MTDPVPYSSEPVPDRAEPVPYAASEPGEIVIAEKRPLNKTGLTALIVVILGYLAPVTIILIGVVSIANGVNSGSSPTAGIVSGLVYFLGAAVAALVLAGIGVIIAIVSLFRKNRGKVLGIVALVLGLLPGVAGVGFVIAISTTIADVTGN